MFSIFFWKKNFWRKKKVFDFFWRLSEAFWFFDNYQQFSYFFMLICPAPEIFSKSRKLKDLLTCFRFQTQKTHFFCRFQDMFEKISASAQIFDFFPRGWLCWNFFCYMENFSFRYSRQDNLKTTNKPMCLNPMFVTSWAMWKRLTYNYSS